MCVDGSLEEVNLRCWAVSHITKVMEAEVGHQSVGSDGGRPLFKVMI